MYHWLELHHVSIPKPLTGKGTRITMIGVEKHGNHAEKSRLLCPQRGRETRTLLSFSQSAIWRRAVWFSVGTAGVDYRWGPEIAFSDSPRPPRCQLAAWTRDAPGKR